MPAAPPSRQEDGPSALRARSRMSAGAGALAAAAAVLVFALHGTHPVFPPGLLPPLAGDGGTIAEETGAATRFLTTGSGPARQFGTHEIVLAGNGSVSNPFNTVARVTFTPPSGPGGAKTVLARFGRDKYEPALTLPSGGDNSYAGLVWHDGLLWMSYYSSHEGKASIYVAQVRIPPLPAAAKRD